MEIKLKRIAKKNTYTIGHLYIDGQYVCDTIEDTDRGLNDNMSIEEIKKIKVYGKTAIPTGTYNVVTNIQSPKFSKKQFYMLYADGGYVPRLIQVPSFDGVLIHCGNTEEDTYGCIIVGQNKIKGKVINSQETFKKIYPIIAKARGTVKIIIE